MQNNQLKATIHAVCCMPEQRKKNDNKCYLKMMNSICLAWPHHRTRYSEDQQEVDNLAWEAANTMEILKIQNFQKLQRDEPSC